MIEFSLNVLFGGVFIVVLVDFVDVVGIIWVGVDCVDSVCII